MVDKTACLLCFFSAWTLVLVPDIGHSQDLSEEDREAIVEDVLNRLKEEELDRRLSNLGQRVESIERRLREIGGGDSLPRIADTVRIVEEITDEVKNANGETIPYLVFDSMASVPEFRRTLADVTQVKLKFRSDFRGIAYINGTKWEIGENLSYVWVPLGRIVVHLPVAQHTPWIIEPDSAGKNALTWDTGTKELTLDSQTLLSALEEASRLNAASEGSIFAAGNTAESDPPSPQ